MARPKTGIVSYGVGNVRSLFNAVEAIGGDPTLVSSFDEALEYDNLILPGVGAFNYAMQNMKARKLDVLVASAIGRNVPVLGICLGMQLFSSYSLEFGKTAGLGFFNSRVTALPAPAVGGELRVPHVAWKRLERIKTSADWLFRGVELDATFYFSHSFAVLDASPDTIATAAYGSIDFAAVMVSGRLVGAQFHPERSGPQGLQFLKNFISRSV